MGGGGQSGGGRGAGSMAERRGKPGKGRRGNGREKEFVFGGARARWGFAVYFWKREEFSTLIFHAAFWAMAGYVFPHSFLCADRRRRGMGANKHGAFFLFLFEGGGLCLETALRSAMTKEKLRVLVITCFYDRFFPF